MVRKIAFLVMALAFLLSSCSSVASQAVTQATSTHTPVLTPYQTMTPKPVTPTATFVVTVPVTPSPTPTPFLHTITNEDTMLGLAFRYGVSLDDLKAANPKVNPNAMTVGSQLVIPINAETPQVLATPTAVPVHVSEPRCVRTGDGGAWCIVAVSSNLNMSVENLSVWFGLYDAQSTILTGQVAYPPLNVLNPGSSMPVMAYFAPPLAEEFTTRTELLSAFAVAAGDTRYLKAELKTDQIVIDPNGTQAQVTGQVLLPADHPTASQVWVLVVAYDTAGNMIGFRKWKSAGATTYDTVVYSLVGSIDHVNILTEVRP